MSESFFQSLNEALRKRNMLAEDRCIHTVRDVVYEACGDGMRRVSECVVCGERVTRNLNYTHESDLSGH